MTINAYVWYDSKAKNYSAPMFLVNDDVAIRQFGMACQDIHTEMGYAPDDFTLFKLGEFDTKSCKMTSLPGLEFIMKGDSFA